MTPDQVPEPEIQGPVPWSDVVTDALRYWEPRRLLYNAVLAFVTIWQLVGHHTAPRPITAAAGMLLVLAVVANMLYSAAYIVDVFVQVSIYRSGWRRRRWLLLVLGTLLGAVLTYFVTQSMFGTPE